MKVSGKKTGIHTNLKSKSLLTIIIRTFNELLSYVVATGKLVLDIWVTHQSKLPQQLRH